MARTSFTVTELNAHIKQLLDADVLLGNVCVTGELSNYKVYPSGHHYFTLKDAESSLRCVMFRSSAQSLRFRPASGMSVAAIGRIAVYPRDGAYQLYCTRLIPGGVGDLYAAYEQLKEQLQKEGLFDRAHKKPLPLFPQRIAVITSAAGAAVRDIIRVLGKRWPASEVVLLPVRVQGTEAPAEIAGAIRYANRYRVGDLIITGRGGGSIEDLWAFNEEEVARAIFACNTPVISAVGHQTDTTISDYVADLRAPTPSAAAELAVFDVQLVEKWLMDYGTQMRRQLELKLNQMRTRLMHDEEKLRYLNPRAKLKENERRLDELGAALERRMQATLEQKRHTLALLSGRLDGMSPLKKLAQGYSYVEDAGGHALTDADTVQIGEALSIHLYRGSLKAAVTEIRKQDAAEDGLEKGRIDG